MVNQPWSSCLMQGNLSITAGSVFTFLHTGAPLVD